MSKRRVLFPVFWKEISAHLLASRGRCTKPYVSTKNWNRNATNQMRSYDPTFLRLERKVECQCLFFRLRFLEMYVQKNVQFMKSMFLISFCLLWLAQRENLGLFHSKTKFPKGFQCKIDNFLYIPLIWCVQKSKSYVQFSEKCTCTKINTVECTTRSIHCRNLISAGTRSNRFHKQFGKLHSE